MTAAIAHLSRYSVRECQRCAQGRKAVSVNPSQAEIAEATVTPIRATKVKPARYR